MVLASSPRKKRKNNTPPQPPNDPKDCRRIGAPVAPNHSVGFCPGGRCSLLSRADYESQKLSLEIKQIQTNLKTKNHTHKRFCRIPRPLPHSNSSSDTKLEQQLCRRSVSPHLLPLTPSLPDPMFQHKNSIQDRVERLDLPGQRNFSQNSPAVPDSRAAGPGNPAWLDTANNSNPCGKRNRSSSKLFECRISRPSRSTTSTFARTGPLAG